ncbi:MAG: CHASE domain-containing protein, partial [Planctomycetota bacterium]
MAPNQDQSSAMRRDAARGSGRWRPRVLVPALAAIGLGLLATLVAYRGVVRLEHRQARSEFARQADDRLRALEQAIADHLQVLESTGAFFDASEQVDRDEFADFAAHAFDRRAGPHAIEWVPRVFHADRGAFESAARDAWENRFRITERRDDDRMVPAADRAEYFPVLYVHPTAGNERAIGYDLAASDVRRRMLEQARDTGQIVATPPISLLQDTGGQAGVLMLLPRFRADRPTRTIAERRQHLVGYICGVFRVGDLLDSALARLQPLSLDVVLSDRTGPSVEQLLVHDREDGRPPLTAEQERAGLDVERTMLVGGRTWVARVAAAPGYGAGTRAKLSHALLVGGPVITLLVAGWLLHLTDRAGRISSLVERRTAELQGQTKRLTDVLEAQSRVEQSLASNNALLRAISTAQSCFISRSEPRDLFDMLLSSLLTASESEYGFIGEVLFDEKGAPYLKTHALTNIAWNEETRNFYETHAPEGLEFRNLKTLFGSVITTGEPVIANEPRTDRRAGGLPPGHPPMRAFLGVPFHLEDRLIGMVGIANRPGGYDHEL